MKKLSAQARAMMLLKAACDVGASSEALALIRATSVLREGEAMINWPEALAQLEQLLTALPTGADRMPALAIELVEDDEDLLPQARCA